MNLQEISNNIHGEVSDYLGSKYDIEDASDMVRHLAGWVRSKGFKPLSWKKGQTGFGSTMFLTKFENEDGIEQWLAFDDQMGVGDITDNEPDIAGYS